jgi:hypothetical protein
MQSALPQNVIRPAQLKPIEHLVAYPGRQLLAQKDPHLLAKSLFLFSKF